MAGTSEQDLNDPPIKTRDELIERLARNRQQILGGTARFNGIPINIDTVLTQFVARDQLAVLHCACTLRLSRL